MRNNNLHTATQEDLPATTVPAGPAAAGKFHRTGFVRLRDVLAPNGPVCVSASTWWAGIKIGRYPKPVKLGPRITAWRVEDILALISETANREGSK